MQIMPTKGKGCGHGNHFLAFCIWDAHWRRLANTTERFVCGGDAVLYQITLTTCYCVSNVQVSDIDVSDESQSVIIADGTTR